MRSANLEEEFWAAIRFKKLNERAAAMLATLGLSNAVQWGAAMVEWWADRRQYEPAHDDQFHPWALIVPVVEDGELIDLAAIDMPSQHVGLRLDVGQGLGLDAVERARYGESYVAGALEEHQHLFERGLLGLMPTPLDWLRDPVGNVYLFDIANVVRVMDGVPEFTCKGLAFAQRVQSLFPPSQRHRVLGVE